MQRRSMLCAALPGLAGWAGWALTACAPQKPIQIGFIGGLTDRNSDNGQSGQNGVVLAIEEFNRAGGVGGRMVELISRDDAQNADTAAKSARELVQAQVEAVIGPFTSGMAKVIVPITAAGPDLPRRLGHPDPRQGRQPLSHQPHYPRQRPRLRPRDARARTAPHRGGL